MVILFFVTSSEIHAFDPFTLLLGAGFGIMYVTTVFSYTKAMESGPLSYTSLFFSAGLLLPIMFGVVFFGEKIVITQLVGIILLILSFYLGSTASGTDGKKIKPIWIAYCLVTFIGNGSLSILSKGHQMLLPGEQIIEYLITAFATSAILSLAALIWYGAIKGQKLAHIKKLGFGGVVVGAGVTTALGNQLIVILVTRVSSVILFPLVNGGVVVSSIIASIMLFGEKLAYKGRLGVFTGVAALVLLSL